MGTARRVCRNVSAALAVHGDRWIAAAMMEAKKLPAIEGAQATSALRAALDRQQPGTSPNDLLLKSRKPHNF